MEKKPAKTEIFAKFLSKRPMKENFLVIVLIGVLVLVIAWPVSETTKKDTQENESVLLDSTTSIMELSGNEKQENNQNYYSGNNNSVRSTDHMLSYATYLETALEELIGTMEGAGEVKVMVQLKNTGETVIEKDTTRNRQGTTEVDAEGGSRNTSQIEETEETIYTTDGSGKNNPYVRQVVAPEVKGVVVSVQGGDNIKMIKNITEVIQALFGIDAHKIKVVKMIDEQSAVQPGKKAN